MLGDFDSQKLLIELLITDPARLALPLCKKNNLYLHTFKYSLSNS